ncbi:unnamed protein product [Closterium sp. Naga37s-1]|nr:unnamed protein product [Closterium sp. Naga37s-1]
MQCVPGVIPYAIGSRSYERAAQFAKEVGMAGDAAIYGSYADVIADPLVDAVYIPLPTALHVEWVHHLAMPDEESGEAPASPRNGLSVLGVFPRLGKAYATPVNEPPRPESPVRSVGMVYAWGAPSSPTVVEPHPSVTLVPGGDEGPSNRGESTPSTVNSAPAKRPRTGGVKYTQQLLWGAKPPRQPPSPPRAAPLVNADEELPKSDADAEYAIMKHRFDSDWASRFPWLRLHRTKAGRPSLKCNVYMLHGDPSANTTYGVKGEGGRDLQLGSMRAHVATRAHKAALKVEAEAEARRERQLTLTRWQATDASTRHIIRCLHIAMFICKADAPIALFVPLCWFLAREGLPDLPPTGGYGAYYTDEALAAKDAATAVKELNMVDDVVRGFASLLSNSNTRMRLTQRYLRVPEGHTFGHGDKMHLPAFIRAHGKSDPDKRKMKVEGVDRDGTPSSHEFVLHERPLADEDPGGEDPDGDATAGDATACNELSTKFVQEVVKQLEKRLRDLSHLDGSKLFLSSKYLLDDDKRVAAFKRWLKQLHVLFRETLPGLCPLIL